MNTLAPSTVTHRDSKGTKFMDIVAAAYDKARLTDGPDGEAQRVNNTPGLPELIGNFIAQNRVPNKYADQEVKSKYAYPKEYKGPKPIHEQCKWFEQNLELDIKPALEYAEHSLPDLKTFVPQGALPYVGWFAVVSDSGLVKLIPQIEAIPGFDEQAVRYCLGINLLLDKIAAVRPFHNWRNGQIVPKQLRRSERTAEACKLIATVQPGDVWLIATQLGVLHRGRSTNRARECFAENEYGCGSLMGGSIAVTHPERFVRWEELDMDLPGDEFDIPESVVRVDYAPCLRFSDGELKFGARQCDNASELYGSASFFLPPIVTGTLQS